MFFDKLSLIVTEKVRGGAVLNFVGITGVPSPLLRVSQRYLAVLDIISKARKFAKLSQQL